FARSPPSDVPCRLACAGRLQSAGRAAPTCSRQLVARQRPFFSPDADTGVHVKEVVLPDSAPSHLNLEQQRKRAKDLLRLAREGDAAALARLTRLLPAGSAAP